MESTKDTKLGGWQSLLASGLTQGRCGACFRRECATNFWSTSTGAPRGTVWLYIGTYTGVASGGREATAGDLLM